jgi:cellulose 1,4-beta-cellobiosidase
VAGDYFNGQLDEVRIYNRALGVAEINTIMHNGDNSPAPPTGLIAAPSNAQVKLSWTPVSAAANYNIKRSNTSGGPYAVIGSSFGAAYNDAGVTNGTTYYYVVSAVNFTNESANSSQVSGRPALGVVFFADVNYSGAASQVLGTGNYTLSQLQASGIANDSSSSCRIPNGWSVLIYQNDNYGGTSWTLTSDTPLFTAYSGLNDNMSSCKITSATFPGIPGNLVATAGNASVALSWNASSGASAYNVKRSTNNGGPYAPLASTTSTAYVDRSAANGTTYYYVVSAMNIAGESANSGQAAATAMAPPPMPSGLAASAGNWQVILSWNASPGADSYNLKRSTIPGGPYALLASGVATNYADTALLSATSYYYVVSATNSAGESPDSAEVSATPIAPPILLSIAAMTNGQFTLQFQGVDGHDYVVLTSSNLLDWVPLSTNQTVGGEFLYTDPNPPDPERFYRVKQ